MSYKYSSSRVMSIMNLQVYGTYDATLYLLPKVLRSSKGLGLGSGCCDGRLLKGV